MTLEVLFAKASQGRTFLLMALCGVGLGLLIPLAGRLHRVNRLLGSLADLLCVAAMAATIGGILLHSGEGLRLYGLLGLCIGGAMVSAARRMLHNS